MKIRGAFGLHKPLVSSVWPVSIRNGKGQFLFPTFGSCEIGKHEQKLTPPHGSLQWPGRGGAEHCLLLERCPALPGARRSTATHEDDLRLSILHLLQHGSAGWVSGPAEHSEQ